MQAKKVCNTKTWWDGNSTALTNLVGSCIGDIYPRLSCIVPEYTHGFTPAEKDVLYSTTLYTLNVWLAYL